MAYDMNSCMVLQPNSHNITIAGNDVATFTEVWKGPWDEIRKLPKDSKIFGTYIIVGLKRPAFNTGSWKYEYDAPKPIDEVKYPWVITDIQIQEGVGDYGTLTLTYSAGTPSWSSENDQPPEKKEDAKVEEYEKIDRRTWSINWQSYNKSVLEYSTIPDKQIKFKENPATEDWTYYANSQTKVIDNFPDNEKERQIATYYTKDISPQFHYPVITLHQEYQFPRKGVNWFADFGNDLDLKETGTLPADCPFLMGGWEWIMTADSGTMTTANTMTFKKDSETGETTETETTYSYTRERQWTGAKHWDSNFYSLEGWEFKKDEEEEDGSDSGSDSDSKQ